VCLPPPSTQVNLVLVMGGETWRPTTRAVNTAVTPSPACRWLLCFLFPALDILEGEPRLLAIYPSLLHSLA